MTPAENEAARELEGRAALNTLLAGFDTAIRNQDPFPFLKAVRDGVTMARNDIGRPYNMRMQSFWHLDGIIRCLYAVQDKYPTEAYLRALHMAQAVVNTDSATWILANKENIQNCANDVVSAEQDARDDLCAKGCEMSYGEGTKEDPDRCVTCGGLFLRDADKPFAMGPRA